MNWAGSNPCAAGALSVRKIWSALHRHEASLWFLDWIVAADPKNPQSHDAIGHCKARLGRFTEASNHFTRAVALAPDRIGYQRDLAMARLALDDRVGYQNACARMIELAEATEDRGAAQMTALTCVLDANTVPQWDAVIRLAARAAKGYDGDYRIHVAALLPRAALPRRSSARGARTPSTPTSAGSGSFSACCITKPAAARKPARSWRMNPRRSTTWIRRCRVTQRARSGRTGSTTFSVTRFVKRRRACYAETSCEKLRPQVRLST